jgi:diguanylate cyclase (GGDEF)-like protein
VKADITKYTHHEAALLRGSFLTIRGSRREWTLSMNKIRILLVQNAQTQGNGTRRALDGMGYEVIWVGSGVSALAATKQWTIALVIIDVALPDIEGGELCRRFRSSETIKDVPIILLAPRGYAVSPMNEQKGGGADVYLAKPYSDGQLAASITTALTTRASEKVPPPLPQLVAKPGPRPHADEIRAEGKSEPQSALIQEQRTASTPQLRQLMQADPRTQGGIAPTPGEKQSPVPEPKTAARPQLQLVRKPEPMPAIHPVDQPPDATPLIASPPEDEVVDPATGLFSRKQFEAMFAKDFKRAVRFKQQISCMIIDLDGRRIGRAGDETTIKSIIGLVQRTIREVDTAAWWTGKELIILLPNTMRNDALQAAMRILETVANHPFTWADSTKVTMSIGVAGLPDRFIDTEQKLIDVAAKACKRAGDLMRP